MFELKLHCYFLLTLYVPSLERARYDGALHTPRFPPFAPHRTQGSLSLVLFETVIVPYILYITAIPPFLSLATYHSRSLNLTIVPSFGTKNPESSLEVTVGRGQILFHWSPELPCCVLIAHICILSGFYIVCFVLSELFLAQKRYGEQSCETCCAF